MVGPDIKRHKNIIKFWGKKIIIHLFYKNSLTT